MKPSEELTNAKKNTCLHRNKMYFLFVKSWSHLLVLLLLQVLASSSRTVMALCSLCGEELGVNGLQRPHYEIEIGITCAQQAVKVAMLERYSTSCHEEIVKWRHTCCDPDDPPFVPSSHIEKVPPTNAPTNNNPRGKISRL